MSCIKMKQEIKLELVYKHSDHSVYKAQQPESGYTIEYYTYTDGSPPMILVISPMHEAVVNCVGVK
jgi:hypothetical protein